MARAGRGLRVVAGAARGRRLRAPPGDLARPTTDRVKEALFAALGAAPVEDRIVLDLYAGSGALAIEALSRGAVGAVLVDRARPAIDTIAANLAVTGFDGQARTLRRDVGAFLRAPPPAEAPFGLVLLDPPYSLATAEVARVLGALVEPGWLADGASVVLERPISGEAPPLPAVLTLAWQRGYGDTLLTVMTHRRTRDRSAPEAGEA